MVDKEWVTRCAAPLLILPGSDPFHPTNVALRISREAPDAQYVDLGWDEANAVPRTVQTVRSFLKARTPA